MEEKIFPRKSIVDNFSKEELNEIVKSSDSWTELSRKLGYHKPGAGSKKTIASRLDYYNISTEHFTHSHTPKKYTDPKQVLCKNSPAADNTIRAWYKKGEYTEYKCSICGLEPIWNNKPLVLTLDHIDGNHKNSEIDNLRWVCPNCDRQLDTFSGKIITNIMNKLLACGGCVNAAFN